MPREYPDYRVNLDLLDRLYPGKVSLRYDNICKLFGYSKRTAIRHWKSVYDKRVGGVPKATIARAMCEQGRQARK